jgi:putative addiction module component (TIGR02574 family)
MSDLLDQIDTLSASEKLALLDALWVSLEGEEQSLTEAQQTELDHRIALYKQNPQDVIPWEQVKANLLKKR